MVSSRPICVPLSAVAAASPFPTPSSGLPLLSGLVLTAGSFEIARNKQKKSKNHPFLVSKDSAKSAVDSAKSAVDSSKSAVDSAKSSLYISIAESVWAKF